MHPSYIKILLPFTVPFITLDNNNHFIELKDCSWHDLQQQYYIKIEVLSDCKVAVDMIFSNNVQDGHIATIREDIEYLVKSFEHCTVSFVPRSANVGSHRLAKFATRLVNDIDRENNFPSWLVEAAGNDWRAESFFCN